jgi:hypothetical protein
MSTELSPQDFFHSYLAEYLDGDLPGGLRQKFEDALKAPGQGAVPEHFQAMRGRLQLSMQSYYLKEGELTTLRSFVQDPSVKATQENLKIDQLGRGEVVNMLLRRVTLVAIAVGLVAVLVWKFMPRSEESFKALEYLGYEALALEEDARDRLDLMTGDYKEIRQYLLAYPKIDFKPNVMKLSGTWKPEGTTVIDYEIAKVSVVQYGHTNGREKLFHFAYVGSISDLPKAEPGNMRGLIYQTYASSEQNLIAWQDGDVVNLLVGRRSAPELAELAVAGRGKG